MGTSRKAIQTNREPDGVKHHVRFQKTKAHAIHHAVHTAQWVNEELEHLNFHEQILSRNQPAWEPLSKNSEVVRDPLDEGWSQYDNGCKVTFNA
jgi:hypothetical protein